MIHNPYVSIVTGTYNRLPFLTRFIDSVRKSIGIGIPYEVVIVDGGSTDGTLPYLKEQKDVVLIEQGKLLGAVKAFNAGCAKAKGKYVILGNDDIEFRYESIQNSIAFMDDHRDVGMGCFPQKRQSLDYTVSKMPAVINGRKAWCYYGQVCIVPKWLGDKLGWWGNYLHTYGGDNELSCNVIESGYKVEPMNSCCIDDLVADDELRKINNPVDHLTGGHPDSQKWVNKWMRNGLIGPNIQSSQKFPTPLKRVPRLVYAPLYESERYPYQLKTKFGLREALSKHFLVSEVNYRYDPEELYYTISMFMPDVVLIQCQDAKIVNYDFMMKVKDEFPNTTFVSWNGDYNEKTLSSSSYIQIMKLFDMASFVTMNYYKDYSSVGINYKYWQVSFEDYEPVPDSQIIKNQYDVVFLANCYSKYRSDLGELLRSHKEWKVGLFGSWPSHIGSSGNTIYNFREGDATYRSSKIALGDNQFFESIGYVSNRMFQAMHSGVFLLQQKIVGMEDLLGFEDGKNLVVWETFEDLEEKIAFWLDPRNDSKRKQIALEGKLFVDRYHSFDSRVNELLIMLSEIKK